MSTVVAAIRNETRSNEQRQLKHAFLINIGMGSTASRSLQGTICRMNLRSCHCLGCCVNGFNVNETVLRSRFKEQLQLFDNNDVAWLCLNALRTSPRQKRCDAFAWRKNTESLLLEYITLMGSKYFGLADIPTEKITDFLLQHAPPHMQFKFLATTRASDVWVQRRKKQYQHPNLICRYDDWPGGMPPPHRLKMNALGSYFDCLDSAAMHLNRTEGESFMHLKEVFTNNKEIDPVRYIKVIEDYQTRYIYDVMRSYYVRRQQQQQLQQQLQHQQQHQQQQQSLRLGENFLHLCYFNKSINFQQRTQREFRLALRKYIASAILPPAAAEAARADSGAVAL